MAHKIRGGGYLSRTRCGRSVSHGWVILEKHQEPSDVGAIPCALCMGVSRG